MDLVAGPQGSGKSTFFPVRESGVAAFNVDEHRKSLNRGSSENIPEHVLRRALADYEAFIEGHIRAKESFSIEVTLGKDITFQQARKAKRAGFSVEMTFVAAELQDCLARVAKRLEAGGHGVPPEVITATHEASMKNLPRALAQFDAVVVYENAGLAGPEIDPASLFPRLVLEAQSGRVTFVAEGPPEWLRKALAGSRFELK